MIELRTYEAAIFFCLSLYGIMSLGFSLGGKLAAYIDSKRSVNKRVDNTFSCGGHTDVIGFSLSDGRQLLSGEIIKDKHGNIIARG